MKNSKQIFKALTENDKLSMIEKVMPCSGSYRQLDESGNFSQGQFDEMATRFVKSIDWNKVVEVDKLDVHDSQYLINGLSENGNSYDAIGFYSDEELIFIEELECIISIS